MYDVDIIRAKIKLKLPLTAGEYAFAILFLNLNPKAYSLKEEKEQTKEAKLPKQ